ncbi:nuclear transport factor 2 family protein [Pedobacter sp. KR3-3]|uniref:Nuclear transport factor 2 family protein n=1 Tax=Pedobacter albus TaxID=3113905 RepID=A0ABU7IBM6_9SPHI|nr:nuclear transport factor 2 family protein [Pedobacter sp. KR3-3]MEE1946691.1 nuclear transport factor 2 family protein [Pedobacter sp. KR3-3]
MKQLSIIILLGVLGFASFAQTNEEEAVKATINQLFEGMRKADTALVRRAFAKQNVMQTIVKGKDGKSEVRTESVDGFIKAVGTPHAAQYDERIVFTKVLVDANLASVWTDYKFYVGDKFSHCGVNSFQLFKGEDGWKIIYIIDTRRKDACSDAVK